MLQILEVQSPSKDQGIVESSKAESSDSDDDFPLVSLVPQSLEKEISQGMEDKEMSVVNVARLGRNQSEGSIVSRDPR